VANRGVQYLNRPTGSHRRHTRGGGRANSARDSKDRVNEILREQPPLCRRLRFVARRVSNYIIFARDIMSILNVKNENKKQTPTTTNDIL